MAESHGTAQYRRSGQVQFARLQDDRYVQRMMLVAVAEKIRSR
jgi:hypothetical protein